MKFTGQVRVPEIDHPGIPASILIEDTQIEVLLEGESLGRWSLHDVRARRLVSSAFQLVLEDEELTFIADEPIDFAYRGVDHMAETWARIKAMRAIPRSMAVKKSRVGVKPSRIDELRRAMEANLAAEARSRRAAKPGILPAAPPEPAEDTTPPTQAASSVRVPDEALSEERARLETERRRLEEERARLEALRHEAEERDARRIEAFRLEMTRLEAERAEHERVEAERSRRFQEEMDQLRVERQRLQGLEAQLTERADVDAAREEAVRAELERIEAARMQMEEAEAARVASAQREMAEVEAKRLELERLEELRAEMEEREKELAALAEAEAAAAEEPEAHEPEPSVPVGPDGMVLDLHELEGADKEPALAGAGARERGLMGAVKSAFTRGGRSHEHVLVPAPGGMGIARSICQECGYVSIAATD